MSDAEDKKELGGLARSIDSLFSGGAEEGAPAAADERDEAAPPTRPEASAAGGAGEASGGGATAPLAEPTASRGPDPTPTVADELGGGWDLPADGPPAVPDAATSPTLDPAESFAGESGAPPPLPEVAASTPPPLPDVVAPTPPPLPEATPAASAADETEPDPLALAVGSYLAGGSDAARVRQLAERHLEAREFTPVAEAVERLALEAGDDPSSERLSLARELLTPLVGRRITQRLAQERDEEQRERFHLVCTRLGPEMAEAIRDEMAEAADRHARRSCFDALVAMGDVSRPVVEAMVEDENRFLARNGIAILGEVGGPGAAELVMGGLANTDPRVRREALLAMARLGVEDADEVIVGRLVDDTDETVRLAAVVASGELRIERAVRPLVAALDEAYEADEVLPLLHALGQIADPGAVPSIEKHAVKERFAKPRTEVRIAAYQALHHIGTPHARRLLNQAVSDKDPEVKAAVKELLHIR